MDERQGQISDMVHKKEHQQICQNQIASTESHISVMSDDGVEVGSLNLLIINNESWYPGANPWP